MNILNGKQRGKFILEQLAQTVGRFVIKPCLGVILVGDDPASHIYVNLKEAAAQRARIGFYKRIFPRDVNKQVILDVIREWNANPQVHGILLQLPLPEDIREATDELIEAIDPIKDVDGFHRVNTERFLASDEGGVYPVFPRAIMELLLMTDQNFAEKQAAIVCNSMRFGKVMQEALRRERIKSHIVLQEELIGDDKGKSDAAKIVVQNADMIITACGIPNLLTGEMIKSGAIVIDGGIAQLPNGKIIGDIDRASVENLKGWLSPVPGGVGPVTVACLLRNVVEFAKNQKTDA